MLAKFDVIPTYSNKKKTFISSFFIISIFIKCFAVVSADALLLSRIYKKIFCKDFLKAYIEIYS